MPLPIRPSDLIDRMLALSWSKLFMPTTLALDFFALGGGLPRENCDNGNFETPKIDENPPPHILQHTEYAAHIASPPAHPAPPANRAHPPLPPAYGVQSSTRRVTSIRPAPPTPTANRAHPPQPPAYRVSQSASPPAPSASSARPA